MKWLAARRWFVLGAVGCLAGSGGCGSETPAETAGRSTTPAVNPYAGPSVPSTPPAMFPAPPHAAPLPSAPFLTAPFLTPPPSSASAATASDSSSTVASAGKLPSSKWAELYRIDVPAEVIQAVQDDARLMNNALYSGDFATCVRLQHDSVIERAGGPAAAQDAMRNMVAQAAARDTQIESIDFPEPPTFLKTSGAIYAIVPTSKVVRVGAERAALRNYLFGVQTSGQPHFTYLDGAQITPQGLLKLFPDFPADYPLPQVSRSKL